MNAAEILQKAYYRRQAKDREKHWDWRSEICPGCGHRPLMFRRMRAKQAPTFVVCPRCSWHKPLPFKDMDEAAEPGEIYGGPRNFKKKKIVLDMADLRAKGQ